MKKETGSGETLVEKGFSLLANLQVFFGPQRRGSPHDFRVYTVKSQVMFYLSVCYASESYFHPG